MPGEPYFSIHNLDVRFKLFEGEKQVLAIQELAIAKGEAYGLIGESGAGKTVLAQTILRLLPSPPCLIGPGSRILFQGENILDLHRDAMNTRIRGSRIAMIFQDPMSTLNPVFTVGKQIIDVIRRHIRGMNRLKAGDRAREILEQVQLPDPVHLMEKYPHELSGGQRQRVIIAIALSCGAEFLIADEPTRNLDVTIQAGILQLLEQLRRELGITLLFIANTMELVSMVCDRVSVLREGRIIEGGTTRSIADSPSHEYTKTLMEPLPQKKLPGVPQAPPRVILEVRDLKKYYPLRTGFGILRTANRWVKAVDGVSFTLYAGETLGIVGESGCGKTTLVNTLLNLEKPTDGLVLFDQVDLTSLGGNQMRAMRRHVQIVFQDPFWSLNPRLLIRDIIGEPLKVHVKQGLRDYEQRVEELLVLCGLAPESAYRFPHEFSGGQRQRIAIARALALDARFIVLDEPTSSIDVVSQKQILGLLDDLKCRYGLTYLVISHDLRVVHYMASHIMVMYLGKIAEYGEADRIFSSPAHPYTRSLMGAIPRPDMRSLDELTVIEGTVPSAINPPKGCRFHNRCSQGDEGCALQEPALVPLADGRLAACHRLKS